MEGFQKRDADLDGLPARISEHRLSEEELAEKFPNGYKEYLLEQRPSKSMSDDELAMLAPWNENVQEKCGNKNK